MFFWFQDEIIILRNSLVKLHIPTYFGWLQDFARTHRFQIHIRKGQIIILLLQKCYYFHVNYYLIICHVLSVILLLHYGSKISSKKQCFVIGELSGNQCCLSGIQDKIVFAIIWSLVVLQQSLRIQGIDLNTLSFGRNTGQTDGCCLRKLALEIDARD